MNYGKSVISGKKLAEVLVHLVREFHQMPSSKEKPGVIFRDSTYTYVQHVVMSETLCPKHTTCERFYILAKDFGVYSMQHHNSCYYQGSRKEGAGGPPNILNNENKCLF